MDERTRFDAWLAGQSGRVTGWMVWCASLALRDYPPEHSRGAFDKWLVKTVADAGRTAAEWELFDAWLAGVEYVKRIMETK
jgi:hypothetical protein